MLPEVWAPPLPWAEAHFAWVRLWVSALAVAPAVRQAMEVVQPSVVAAVRRVPPWAAVALLRPVEAKALADQCLDPTTGRIFRQCRAWVQNRTASPRLGMEPWRDGRHSSGACDRNRSGHRSREDARTGRLPGSSRTAACGEAAGHPRSTLAALFLRQPMQQPKPTARARLRTRGRNGERSNSCTYPDWPANMRYGCAARGDR